MNNSRNDHEISKIEKNLAMVGITTAAVIHEIKSHILIISSQAENLKKEVNHDGSEKEKVLKAIERIIKTSDAMTSTVKNTQSILFDTSNEKEVIDLPESVYDALEYLDHKLNRFEIKAEFIENYPGVQVFAQKGLLTQVVINLVSNAINAIKEMEERWIKIELDQKLDPSENREIAILRVIDSGSIPEEIRDSIFRPMFTTGSKGESTGLGLFLTSKIIEDHKGKIELDRKTKNTTFSIQIPI